MKRPPKPDLPVVVLTPEQQHQASLRTTLDERLAALEVQYRKDKAELRATVAKCKDHVWILGRYTKYEWWDRWVINATVFCAICDKNGGWYCPVNPTRQCEYVGSSEYCIHCSTPDERK